MRILFSAIGILAFHLALSQNVSDKVKQKYIIGSQKVITKTDTITQFELAEVSLSSSFTEEYKKYMWYRAIVSKVYPYTMFIKDMVIMYDSSFASIKSRKDKKEYRNEEYEKLKEKFGYFVSKLQETEGRVFCKMIHKETGLTAYEITKKYLGGSKAFMWQSVAWLGGADLKNKYDAKDEDGIILEKVHSDISSGKLLVMKKLIFVPQKKDKKKNKISGENVTVVRK